MNKFLLTIVAALLVTGSAMAARCGSCPRKKACAPKTEVHCAPKPKCVQRCVVEKCVEPVKHCETNCYYTCPDTCETMGSDYQPQHKDVTNRGAKRAARYSNND